MPFKAPIRAKKPCLDHSEGQDTTQPTRRATIRRFEMKCEKPDGVIELGFSACCCHPGERGEGQHTNGCTKWYRIHWRDGEVTPWESDPWPSKTRRCAVQMDSCTRFLEYLKTI